MQVITSKENEQIKQIRKLKDKKFRDEQGLYIIEGVKTINEAIEEDAKIETIVICDDCEKQGTLDQKLLYEVAKYNLIYVNEKVFGYITEVMNPQGILAVVSKKEKKKINYNEDIIVVLDNIQDPGNLGTIIRTLDSAGIKQIILSKGTVDVYSSKVVRSTMGAIFRINIIESENLKDTIKTMQKHEYEVMATSLQGAKSIYDVKYKKVAIVIGNEAKGVSKEILELSNQNIKIPMIRKNRKSKCSGCNKYNCI